jgi:hypothetical protein
MYGEDANVAKTTDSVRKRPSSLAVQLAKAWPFTRVNPKLLERAHRQAIKPDLSTAEEAPF